VDHEERIDIVSTQDGEQFSLRELLWLAERSDFNSHPKISRGGPEWIQRRAAAPSGRHCGGTDVTREAMSG
jgi:hypothetical protein